MQYLVYLWPVLTISFIILFFHWYFISISPRVGSLEWISMRETPAFVLARPKIKTTKSDIFLIIGVTLLYAAVAFYGLGTRIAPQSFWQATEQQPTVFIDLGEQKQITEVTYYTGLYPGSYYFTVSSDGKTYTRLADLDQNYAVLFRWQHADISGITEPIRYMRITSAGPPMELGELAIYAGAEDGSSRLLSPDEIEVSDPGKALFDEQNTIPQKISYLTNTYFDEIYHARTAYENDRNIYPYEITHPPLGKLILMLGIKLFGMTPFGWRFMGTLFGVLMLPAIFALAKSLFGRTNIALCVTLVFAFDFMHFTQTRIATIDGYSVFFILMMYLFMWRWFTAGYETPLRKTLPALFLSGLFFGLGAATKWICLYAGAGLLVLYVIYLVMRARHQIGQGDGRKFARFLTGTLAFSVLFFLVIPVAIYCASYIPYVFADNKALTLANLWDQVWRNQTYMFNYHSNLVATHPYSSSWYQWIFDIRPILYYADYADNSRSVFGAFGNPLFWWSGLIALLLTGYRFVKQRSAAALFIVIGFLSQFAPWLFVSRITFAYHYFPSTLFLALALGYIFTEMIERYPDKVNRIYLFTGLCVFLFAAFYPVLTGARVYNWYTADFLRWMPSWPY